MSDLRTRLDRLAERGEPRGAAAVYRRAIEQMDGARSAAVPISAAHSDRPRRGRWRAAAAVIAVFAVVGAAVLIGRNHQHTRVRVTQPATTTKHALATEPSAKLFLVDGNGVVEGNPKTGRQLRLSSTSNACQACAGSRLGRYVFLTQPTILRVDTTDGTVKDLGPGKFVFPHPDGASLYV